MALTKVTGQVIKNTTDVTVGVLTVTNTLAVGGTVSIGGTLTYEDVTNVDAVGLVTARNGIVVGSGITLSKDGDVFFTGIATGNGSGLTALNASNLASGTVPTARLGSGTASSSTFLRGDSSFQTITTDLVGDTSPQLGGNLDVNTKNIVFGDSGSASDDRLTFGAGTDLSIYHDGTHTYLNNITGNLRIQNNGTVKSAQFEVDQVDFNDSANSTVHVRKEPAGNFKIFKNLSVAGVSTFTGIAQFANTINLTHASAGQNYIYFNEDLQFAKNGTGTRLKIDSSGRLLIGATSAREISGHTPSLQLQGTQHDTQTFSIVSNSADSNPAYLFLSKQRSGSVGGSTIIQNNDRIGEIRFNGHDGNDFAHETAIIASEVDGTPGTNDMPGRLIFATTADGAGSISERLRITSDGKLLLGTTTSNAPTGSLHVKNAYIRLQAANQQSTDFTQEVGIEWSQEEGSDVQVGKIVMRRTGWSGAPHSMDFYSRNSSNQVLRSMTIDHDGGIYFQRLLGNAASGSAVKYSNSDKELRYDTSSKLLKTNITELTKYGIDTVKKLKPSTFTPQEYNKDGTITVGDQTLIGFIADEMVTEVPEVVQMYPKSTLTKQEEDTEIVPAAISYDKLTVVLTKALQEAIAKIETLETEVAALKSQLNN